METFTPDTSVSSFKTKKYKVGDVIDELNGIKVYYNGEINNISGRNLTEDGYNLGLLYQCVEFVKRYYYSYYQHKMPDSYGHAFEFFDQELGDGAFNAKRALFQFSNGSSFKPKPGDIIVFDKMPGNEFGHVAIIAALDSGNIEIIQQNVLDKSRVSLRLVNYKDQFFVANKYVLGWLRI